MSIFTVANPTIRIGVSPRGSGATEIKSILLSGDMTDGDDKLLLSGDMTDGDDEEIFSGAY